MYVKGYTFIIGKLFSCYKLIYFNSYLVIKKVHTHIHNTLNGTIIAIFCIDTSTPY